MNVKCLFAVSAVLFGCCSALFAAVEEFKGVVPDAAKYETIYKADVTKYAKDGYITDNSLALKGKLKKLAYYLKLTDKKNQVTWVFVSMDPFTQDLANVGFPGPDVQQIIKNMEVLTNVKGVEKGKFATGSVEFTAKNYMPAISKKIPGGVSGKFDINDTFHKGGNYGCLQVHNYLKKQTVFAVNHFNHSVSEFGIGNRAAGNPDWTFSDNSRNYKSAILIVAGQFDDLKKLDIVPLQLKKVSVIGTSSAKTAEIKAGETVKFTFKMDIGGQKYYDADPYYLVWTRTGDDGVTRSEKTKISPDKPVVVEAKMDKPGFFRLLAWLENRHGKNVSAQTKYRLGRYVFDGGHGVAVNTLKQAVPEPADFDAFWAKQKAKLKAVPLKYKMVEVKCRNPKFKMYKVSIDCAGPRPVTGYLSMPKDAKPKSLPAVGSFHGYGTSVQRQPGVGGRMISFVVNAHGYDLEQPAAYYKKFFASIRSNGRGYAFDPKQNADPEKAYFLGMALRVMRAYDFLKSLPQWDGKNLTAAGGSQGGLQTVWAASLVDGLTMARPTVPWCGDIGGEKAKRIKSHFFPAYAPGLRYFDIVNHAKRIPASCYVNVTRAGLGDYVCPPSGVQIFYNNVKGPKEITWVQNNQHGGVRLPGSNVSVVKSK